jgi:signal transduction histidine kinase
LPLRVTIFFFTDVTLELELIIALILLAIALGLQLIAYARLRERNKLVRQQSQEIQRQVAELEKRNKELQELSEERAKLIGLVSHDLKGPFNRIFALVNLMHLSYPDATADQQEFLGKIQHISADGLAMVRNLLDKRRIEERGIDLVPESMNLAAQVTTFVRGFQTVADKKDIRLQLNCPAEIILEADKLYLNRIIENLLGNAVKFSEKGKNVFIDVTATATHAVLVVRDEGPGISPEDQKKLYQNYMRLSARPTGGESSTGLGLSIVKEIVDKMKGDIRCDSQENRGTTFTVRLPLVMEDEPARANGNAN